MKKSAFITLGACALASIAVIRIKSGFRRLKQTDWAIEILDDRNTSGMFV